MRIERGQCPLFTFKMITIPYIKDLIEKKLDGTDQFLVDVKLSPSKLIVAIDKPTGILLDECSKLNKYLASELETSGFLETHEIEITSPGMDQPLKVYQQYLRRIGRELNVITIDGKFHKGKLLSANNITFELLEITTTKVQKKKIKHENTITINYNEIKESKLELKF